jgi:hypothetical protein
MFMISSFFVAAKAWVFYMKAVSRQPSAVSTQSSASSKQLQIIPCWLLTADG